MFLDQYEKELIKLLENVKKNLDFKHKLSETEISKTEDISSNDV